MFRQVWKPLSKTAWKPLFTGFLLMFAATAWPQAPLPLLKEEVTSETEEQLTEESEEFLDTYLRLLRNENEETRLKVIEVLGSLEMTDEIAAALIDRMADPRRDVREQAVGTLYMRDVDSPAFIAALGRQMSDPEVELRSNAVSIANTYGEKAKSLVPIMLKVLADERNDSFVTENLDALSEIGPGPEAAPILKAKYEQCGADALYTLARIKPLPQDLIPWLREIMNGDEEIERRAAAAWALGRCGDQATVLAAAKSKDETLRMIGLEGISGLPKPPAEVYALIAAALQDPSSRIREYAVQAASYVEEPPQELLAGMFRAYGDINTDVREWAVTVFDRLIEEKKLTRKTAWAIIDKGLLEKPNDVGLLLAMASIVGSLAYDESYEEHAKAVALYNEACKGLIRVVLKPEVPLTGNQKRELSTLLYDAACIACRAEKHDLAMKYLQVALEHGWTDIEHARDDYDFEPISETEAFKQLLLKYEKRQ